MTDILHEEFDVESYRNNNVDLQTLLNNELIQHFLNHGHKEKRIWQKEFANLTNSLKSFNKIYPHFNINIYRNRNKDLCNKSNKELMVHYHVFGQCEKRICNDHQVTSNNSIIPFYYNLYLKELTNGNLYNTSFALAHFNGNINDDYKKNIELLMELNIPQTEHDYMYKLRDFITKYYNTDVNFARAYNEIITNAKLEFRYFCFRYIDYIRTIPVKNIQLNQKNEAVLIEMRSFPHLEFTIRNSINKLPDNWSHTIVCGNLNYTFVKNMCSNISPNIKIMQLDYDNLDTSVYSKVLASSYFWNNLYGEKILIYQEDACIFKSNIDDFMQYDYIGAPWYLCQNDNDNLVGNGGFSLRTKSVMLKVIETIGIMETTYNSHTLEYMKHVKLTVPPEDVYFSKNIIDHKLGVVATHNVAQTFSVETIYNENPFGGHNFHICMKKWKQHMYKHVVKQSNVKVDFGGLEHRCGWAWIMSHLMKNDLVIQYNEHTDLSQRLLFFDTIERHFMWEKAGYVSSPWIGVIHCTNIAPEYLNIINIESLFSDDVFIKSLQNCKFLIVLSDYLKKYVDEKLKQLRIDLSVTMVKYPCFDDVVKFDWNKFIANENKTIVQLGQQLRIITSIYILKTNYKKLWLPGTKNTHHIKYLFENECKLFNLTNIMITDVEMDYYDDYSKFDELLSKNVVFINLFDASANTTIIECIIRNTPLIINKLDAVVEYLGENYPLYFDNIEDVDKLLCANKLYEAHIYLKNMNKCDLNISWFVNFFSNAINNF